MGGPATQNRVLRQLVRARSGISFIYSCLSWVAHRWELDDALLVVDDATFGRQVFRLDRGAVEGPWATRLAFEGEPGLHTRPALPDDAPRAVFEDLADVALRMDVLRLRSQTDPLTGLANRHGFDADLQRAIDRSARYGERFSLAIIDLDNFKDVNDRFGHVRGDEVLQQVGRDLNRVLRGADVAARLGGDEFALVLTQTGQAQARTVVDRLTQQIKTSVDLVTLGVSAGIATCPDDGDDPTRLYEIADRRLYETKGARR